jgi:hypothetical protein
LAVPLIFSIAELIIVGPMRRAWLVPAAVMLAAAVISAQEPPPLEVVLERAGKYVAEYQRGLRGIVAEEEYYQNFTTSRGSPGARGRVVREGRRLKSDLLLVKLGAEERWMQFRDVFEVDRRPRLRTGLHFLSPGRKRMPRTQAIAGIRGKGLVWIAAPVHRLDELRAEPEESPLRSAG